jgi:hypothetical protein
MKFLFTIIAISLLSACASQSSVTVLTGSKCTSTTPTTGDCPSGDVVGLIERDAKGAPNSVNVINACEGTTVTWKYKDVFPVGEAPPFLVIFDPDIYPGKSSSSYKVLSKPIPNTANFTNQEFTLNTRKLKGTDDECLNYAIMIPGKGLLDPVFIIKK